MARDHARIFVSIWADDDFRARSPEAQRLYMLLLTQPKLTYAGSLELQPRRWSACSEWTTVEDVEDALGELERSRFVVVDRDTEEILVRAYLRVNEVWKQPKLLTLALRQVQEVQSRKLRSALRSELLRLPDEPRADPARTLAETLPNTPWHTPPDTPPHRPSGTRFDTPSEPLPEPPAQPLPEPVPEPSRAHAGARVTSNPEQVVGVVLEGNFGGNRSVSNARDPRTPPRCPRHHSVEFPPNCGSCADARRAADTAAKAAKATPTPPPAAIGIAGRPKLDPQVHAAGIAAARAAAARRRTS